MCAHVWVCVPILACVHVYVCVCRHLEKILCWFLRKLMAWLTHTFHRSGMTIHRDKRLKYYDTISKAFVVVLLLKACGFDMSNVKYPQSRVCLCVCMCVYTKMSCIRGHDSHGRQMLTYMGAYDGNWDSRVLAGRESLFLHKPTMTPWPCTLSRADTTGKHICHGCTSSPTTRGVSEALL